MCFTFCEVSALLRYLAKRHMRRGKNHQAAKQGKSHHGVLSPTLGFLLSSPCFILQGNKIFCLLNISLLVLGFGHYWTCDVGFHPSAWSPAFHFSRSNKYLYLRRWIYRTSSPMILFIALVPMLKFLLTPWFLVLRSLLIYTLFLC